MNKLPPTSYVRFVDIWLITGQLLPFLEVVLLTVKELFFQTEITNHHGKAKTVDSQSTQDLDEKMKQEMIYLRIVSIGLYKMKRHTFVTILFFRKGWPADSVFYFLSSLLVCSNLFLYSKLDNT